MVTPVRRGLAAFVMLAALAMIFVGHAMLTLTASAALVAYLSLSWRQFTLGTWVPVILSIAALAVALQRGISASVLLQAVERALFLAALIAMLGTLRSAASIAPEVARAGLFLTSRPASQRYVALASGGHLFGVLINFGGLALLLDLAMRSMNSPATQDLPPDIRKARLRRMSLAIIRGFGLISLWSPFGFATNAILITLPGMSYFQFGPIGFAMSFVFLALGWLFDRLQGRGYRRLGLPPPAPPPGAWIGALALLGHIFALGTGVVVLHEVTTLSFQQALILVVPAYSIGWAAASGSRSGSGVLLALREAGGATWDRLSAMGPEIGVFASAGFLPVVLLALVPLEPLRMGIGSLGMGAVPLALSLAISIVALAFVGINPIVTASVLGAIAAQLAVPGLSQTAIALAITGGWTAVIGMSPFITTIIITASITRRSVWQVGPVWNGAYSGAVLIIWCALLAGLMWSGLI